MRMTLSSGSVAYPLLPGVLDNRCYTFPGVHASYYFTPLWYNPRWFWAQVTASFKHAQNRGQRGDLDRMNKQQVIFLQ
jgi:hypothetical protein